MQGKEYKRKERKKKRKGKKDERRVEPVSGGFVSSRLQSDKPLHHGPSLVTAPQYVYFSSSQWCNRRQSSQLSHPRC